MKYHTVLSVTTLNTLCALQRIVFIFKRNHVHMEQLHIFDSNMSGISHCSIVLHSNQLVMDRLMKQLQRVIEVLDVKICNQIIVQ